jgi:hypothetical protein
MHDISLVTSLYRSEAFLEEYTHQVLEVAMHLKQDAGLSLEVVIVANDASEDERRWIRELSDAASMTGTPTIFPIYVERETVYASWNRGIQTSSGRCISVWNVDDPRTVEALVEGYRRIEQGCGLVYFPYTLIRLTRIWGVFKLRRREQRKAQPYNYETFTRRMQGLSFFMFSRELYDKVGPFDEHFKISGDFEWCTRAAEITDFCQGTQQAGYFVIHGRNLSDVGNPLQRVEENVIHLRRGAWENLNPVDPDLMRTCWERWGCQEALPPEIEEQLWGEGAYDRWQRWLREQLWRRRRARVTEPLRKFPRFFINRTGLRPWVARLGIVKSATWER